MLVFDVIGEQLSDQLVRKLLKISAGFRIKSGMTKLCF
jgi:hypothetical protein